MKRIITLLLVVVAMTMAAQAQAQMFPATKTGTEARGLIIPVYNTVDSLNYDGETVMIDTTATIKNFGVAR